jgi:pyruvate formate lyase activating enzyme
MTAEVCAVASRRAEPTGTIFNVMRYSLHDGPGIRTTVFFKGCPLACWWCHNPEGRSFPPEPVYYADRCRHCGECAEGCPEHAIEESNGEMRATLRCRRCGTCVDICSAGAREIAGRRATLSEVMSEIEKDTVFFDESGGGVTLSGGEPAAQPEFAEAILESCRARRIHTAVETCGFTSRKTLLRIAARAGLVLYDLKLIDDTKHRRYTGVSNESILGNLEALNESGCTLTVRIPVIPGVNDSAVDAADFVRFLRRTGIRSVHLLPYHRIGAEKYRRLGISNPLENLEPASNGEIRSFQDVLVRAGLDVNVGG